MPLTNERMAELEAKGYLDDMKRDGMRNVRPPADKPLPVVNFQEEEAAARDETCPECDGTGSIDIDCPACGGDCCDSEGNPCRKCDATGLDAEECQECDGSGVVRSDTEF